MTCKKLHNVLKMAIIVKVHKIRKNSQLYMYNSKLQGETIFNLDFMVSYEKFIRYPSEIILFFT